jgi:diguanylate cyclase (GGDEF)-like protein
LEQAAVVKGRTLSDRVVIEALAGAVDGVVAVFDGRGEILIVNERFISQLGLKASAGERLSEVLVQSPRLSFEARRALEELIGQPPNGATKKLEAFVLNRLSGETFTVEVKAVAPDRTLFLLQPEAAQPEGPAHAQLDPLTGLLSRIVLRQTLAGASAGTSFALMLIDLDRFKAVNDTLGHPIGDALLRTVAERLRSIVRAEDLIARVGGDEFAIVRIAQNEQNEQNVAALAARIVDLLARSFILNGHLVNIGASVGITLAPQDAADPDSLLVQADLALYQAKANGRSTFCFFRPEMRQRAQARRDLELELRKALMLRQFELHYQPQVDLATNRLVGFEALLRWRHPTRGLLGPSAFVPVLEELGLIVPVGEWVLQTACSTAASWSNQLSVAVNISAAQFESDRLVASVMGALEASGLPPDQLEVEVTESALIRNGETTRGALKSLRELGVHVAIDDFGTGYSSLTQLRSFPFDRIKIDRSFISGAAVSSDDTAIVKAITGLGASLGMRTTAEGVETVEQLEQIRAHGCSQVQGYLLGRPVPQSELHDLIKALGPHLSGAAPEPSSRPKD